MGVGTPRPRGLTAFAVLGVGSAAVRRAVYRHEGGTGDEAEHCPAARNGPPVTRRTHLSVSVRSSPIRRSRKPTPSPQQGGRQGDVRGRDVAVARPQRGGHDVDRPSGGALRQWRLLAVIGVASVLRGAVASARDGRVLQPQARIDSRHDFGSRRRVRSQPVARPGFEAFPGRQPCRASRTSGLSLGAPPWPVFPAQCIADPCTSE